MIARSTPVAVKPHVWRIVKCPECGKTMCSAKPGSIVKTFCKRCKQEVVTNVA